MLNEASVNLKGFQENHLFQGKTTPIRLLYTGNIFRLVS